MSFTLKEFIKELEDFNYHIEYYEPMSEDSLNLNKKRELLISFFKKTKLNRLLPLTNVNNVINIINKLKLNELNNLIYLLKNSEYIDDEYDLINRLQKSIINKLKSFDRIYCQYNPYIKFISDTQFDISYIKNYIYPDIDNKLKLFSCIDLIKLSKLFIEFIFMDNYLSDIRKLTYNELYSLADKKIFQ